jgi:hypothetical protein
MDGNEPLRLTACVGQPPHGFNLSRRTKKRLTSNGSALLLFHSFTPVYTVGTPVLVEFDCSVLAPENKSQSGGINSGPTTVSFGPLVSCFLSFLGKLARCSHSHEWPARGS